MGGEIGTWTASQCPQLWHILSHLGGLDPINNLTLLAFSSPLFLLCTYTRNNRIIISKPSLLKYMKEEAIKSIMSPRWNQRICQIVYLKHASSLETSLGKWARDIHARTYIYTYSPWTNNFWSNFKPDDTAKNTKAINFIQAMDFLLFIFFIFWREEHKFGTQRTK